MHKPLVCNLSKVNIMGGDGVPSLDAHDISRLYSSTYILLKEAVKWLQKRRLPRKR
jgi:hypothetical protein